MRKPIDYCIVALLLLCGSCKKEDLSNYMTKETVIKNDTITQSKADRGILTMKNLNGKYVVYEWCPLVYKDTFPAWIEDKHQPDFSIKEYKFEPCISDIDVPYVLFKRKDENYFFIIKNTDTLKFRIKK